ncbi:glycosyltransferase [candidate division KSB1 bacterium]|nr:glycosyltransferase [candidate division KSB1 bacterium]
MKKKIRIALGGAGTETHVRSIIETVNDFDVKHEFTISCLPSRNAYFTHLHTFDIYQELFGYHATTRYIINKMLGKKNICFWIGSDVLLARADGKALRRTLFTAKFVDLQLAISPNLVEELKPIGIHASEWMIPVKNIEALPIYPLPDTFAVLTYLPDQHHQFYGSAVIYQLAEELPEIPFMVIGGNAANQKTLPNLQYLGWVQDMESIYKRTSVLIRATQHDGCARMITEALARGINVIFKAHKRPFCHHAVTYNQIKKTLLSLRENLWVNEAGAEYVRRTYQYEKLGNQLLDIYRALHYGGER